MVAISVVISSVDLSSVDESTLGTLSAEEDVQEKILAKLLNVKGQVSTPARGVSRAIADHGGEAHAAVDDRATAEFDAAMRAEGSLRSLGALSG